jgi:hypothetical protein
MSASRTSALDDRPGYRQLLRAAGRSLAPTKMCSTKIAHLRGYLHLLLPPTLAERQTAPSVASQHQASDPGPASALQGSAVWLMVFLLVRPLLLLVRPLYLYLYLYLYLVALLQQTCLHRLPCWMGLCWGCLAAAVL